MTRWRELESTYCVTIIFARNTGTWAFFFERRFQPLSVGGFFSNQRESISRCLKSPFPSKTQNRQIARTSPLTKNSHEDRVLPLTKIYPNPTPIEPCDSANQEREEPRTIVNHVSEPEISNVSQEVNQNELLRFKGRIGGHDAVILIDSGSTHDLISAEFIQKYRIDTRNLEGPFEVTMADGRTCSTAQSCTEPLTLVLPNQN